MGERWTPHEVPAGPLGHKDWTLPVLGTDPYPWHDEVNDEVNDFTVRSFGSHRGLYEACQRMRAEHWMRAVGEYEAEPRRFGRAWRYLDSHPILYKFRMDESTPTPEILQERNLESEFGFTRIYHRVSEWCAPNRGEEGCDHPKADVQYMEFGQWSWPGEPHPDSPEPRPGLYGYHDYKLDVYGDTYEECVVQAAYALWLNYGNDRRACGD